MDPGNYRWCFSSVRCCSVLGFSLHWFLKLEVFSLSSPFSLAAWVISLESFAACWGPALGTAGRGYWVWGSWRTTIHSRYRKSQNIEEDFMSLGKMVKKSVVFSSILLVGDLRPEKEENKAAAWMAVWMVSGSGFWVLWSGMHLW